MSYTATALGWISAITLLILPPVIWLIVWQQALRFGLQRQGTKPILALVTIAGVIAMSVLVLVSVLRPSDLWTSILGMIAAIALLIQASPFIVGLFVGLFGRRTPH